MNTRKASIIFLLFAWVAGLTAQINLTNNPNNNWRTTVLSLFRELISIERERE